MRLHGRAYRPEPDLLAPTAEIVDGVGRRTRDWPEHELRFYALLVERRITAQFEPVAFGRAYLLCNEPEPHHSHRRLVSGHLQRRWKDIRDIEVVHL